MNTEPIRYGIVALGRAGWDIHVAALRNRADAKIVACPTRCPSGAHRRNLNLDAKPIPPWPSC